MVSAVLLLWSMIVVSGALFVVSDCGFWCGFFSKLVVSVVLILWSLVVVSGKQPGE